MAKAATMAMLAVGVNLVAYGFVNKSEVDGCPEGSSSGS
jgi:hypothetical protein